MKEDGSIHRYSVSLPRVNDASGRKHFKEVFSAIQFAHQLTTSILRSLKLTLSPSIIEQGRNQNLGYQIRELCPARKSKRINQIVPAQ